MIEGVIGQLQMRTIIHFIRFRKLDQSGRGRNLGFLYLEKRRHCSYMNGIIHDRNGSYTEESQEGCALNLLQTDQQNIPKLQATEVQWQDYD